MASKTLGTTKVVVDGFPIDMLTELRVDVDTGELIIAGRSRGVVTLRSNDVTLAFNIQGQEYIGDTVYFYGPLRTLFPELFKDIDLLPWQVDYLTYYNRPSLDRFKLRRDDPFFTTEVAEAYLAGHKLGYEKGAVNQSYNEHVGRKSLQNSQVEAKEITEATQTFYGKTSEFAERVKKALEV